MKEPFALLAVALASLLSIAAAADPREDFKRAYSEYRQHMAADNEALALDAIRMYRYAPHFVNGAPLAVDDVEYTISFGRP